MKKVEAYIRPDKLKEVTDALRHQDGVSTVHLIETTRRLGWKKYEFLPGRENDDAIEEASFIKIEVFCENSVLTSDVIFDIEKNAYTGERGDGEIYVSDVEVAEQIRTSSFVR